MSTAQEHDCEAAIARLNAAQAEQQITLVSRLGLIPFKDGNAWCVLWGKNLQEGIAGFGPTPSLAIEAFNNAYYQEKP